MVPSLKNTALQVSFKGFGIAEESIKSCVDFEYEGEKFQMKHGSVVIAAITSCTNTSNPTVMLGAGKLFKTVEIKIETLFYNSLIFI